MHWETERDDPSSVMDLAIHGWTWLGGMNLGCSRWRLSKRRLVVRIQCVRSASGGGRAMAHRLLRDSDGTLHDTILEVRTQSWRPSDAYDVSPGEQGLYPQFRLAGWLPPRVFSAICAHGCHHQFPGKTWWQRFLSMSGGDEGGERKRVHRFGYTEGSADRLMKRWVAAYPVCSNLIKGVSFQVTWLILEAACKH
jgi:hypothetical protein